MDQSDTEKRCRRALKRIVKLLNSIRKPPNTKDFKKLRAYGDKLWRPTEQAFQLFKEIAPLRPCSCDAELDQTEEDFLQLYLSFSKPLPGHDNLTILAICYRELPEKFAFLTPYAESPKKDLWSTVFEALHNTRSLEMFIQYERYIQKLDAELGYARYLVYVRLYEWVLEASTEMRNEVITQRAADTGILGTITSKAKFWISAPSIFGALPLNESGGGTFLRLSDIDYVKEFLQLSATMHCAGGTTHGNAIELVRDAKLAFRWMWAVGEASQAIVDIQTYRWNPQGGFEIKVDKIFGKSESFEQRIFRRFQRAYELITALSSEGDFECGFEREMATFLVGQIAWLFTALKDNATAKYFERFYLECRNFYPDDDFAWNERFEILSFRQSHDPTKWDENEVQQKELAAQTREEWDQLRMNERMEWERRSSPPPTRKQPDPVDGDEPPGTPDMELDRTVREKQARVRHLRWVFGHPLSTWVTRQDAINSPADLYCFMEWLSEKVPPKDARRRDRFKENLFRRQEYGECTRSMCKLGIQIYHPDRNVREETNWQLVATEVTKVLNEILSKDWLQ